MNSIAEDVEEENGRFEESSFLRMREPLLLSPSTDDNGNSEQLRQRPTTSSSSANADADDDSQDRIRQQHQFQPQRQRLLDRNGVFGQSRGRWGVERRLPSGPSTDDRRQQELCSFPWCCCRKFYRECAKDWFFWLAYKKTIVLFFFLFCSYALIICFFGFIYLSLSIFGSQAEVNPDGSTKIIAFCDMDINDHMEAMYFSLSTMTTIGYGVSDYYFGGCYSPLLIVLLQICTAIVFDAVAVGLIFHRISRGAKRSRSILFSDKAVVRNVRGVPHLMFRLGERRKHHLIEATVRCYCIRHERIPNYFPHSRTDAEAHILSTMDDGQTGHSHSNKEPNDFRVGVETTSFVSRQMRLVQPDDTFGSHLWMGLPQVVVHRIDERSPLMPSAPLWFDVRGAAHRYPPPGATSTSGDQERGDGLVEADPSSLWANLGCVQSFLRDRDVELVVLIEGTDEGTGAATQARHSYKLCDIAWNHRFADCVHPYSRRQRSGPSNLDPVVSIDFSKFHDILPAPVNCDACAYVPN
mmetsp:Transcript_26503/g.56795  ORF Transcript_26503/g.56795 Transcript_26503/m.56795 type:complete len:524 (+) Transcript_26503:37-1608(+)